MFKAIQDWLGSGNTNSTEAAAARNSAVAVTVEDLISLKFSAQQLNLSSSRIRSSSITGNHPSRFRGRGMDYQESRVYQPGDDVRSMDWRVTARAGSPYVKLYEEERERPVMLLVDLNPGMFFASRGAFKSVVAAKLSALIAWVAVSRGDRVGGLVFNGEHIEIAPRGSARGALQLIRQLVHCSEPGKTMDAKRFARERESNSLASALHRCRRVARPGSLIFVLSDFYQLGEETRGELRRLRQHNEVVAVQIADPLEMTPPPAAVYGISDGNEYGVIDTRRPDQQQYYRDWCGSHQDDVEMLMRQHAIPLLKVSTTDDVVRVVRHFLSGSRETGHVNRQRAAS
jgi:uncharacterized protein (DUF58 family)